MTPIAQEIRVGTDKWEWFKRLYTAKETLNRMKETAYKNICQLFIQQGINIQNI
jgi:hypothetical protein